MPALLVENVRSGTVESVHRVCTAVVTANNRLVASSGDPGLVTFARSAIKPFQALPLVKDGVQQRFDITSQELALACASHNSQTDQVELVRSFLDRIGCSEQDLACGPHRPLGASYSVPSLDPQLLARPSPLASNCAGKHTGMLALALHHGWNKRGYEESSHPVQRRVKRELASWVSMDEAEIGEGTDGCGVVAFALPLSRMALGMARLVERAGEPESTIVAAMVEYPHLVAGERRLGTELMRAYRGQVIVKVGAEGVYLAALSERCIGVALKVEDGDPRAAMVALIAVLEQLGLDPSPSSLLPRFAELPIQNTRGRTVGSLRPKGGLSFV